MASVLEEVQCCGLTLHLPTDLCTDFSLLTEIISPETWNNCLTDDNRQALMNLLPTFPENDLEEKTRTLEMFFMDVNFRFGTPLRQFHQQLQQGHFNPAIAKFRQKKEARRRILCRYQYREYLHNTLEDTIIHRQQYLELASSLPPDSVPSPLAHLSVSLTLPGGLRPGGRLSPQLGADVPSSTGPPPPWRGMVEHRTKRRYFRELMALRAEAGISSELSEDENYPDGPGMPMSKKQRRQLVGAESCLPQHLLPVRHTHSTGSLAKDLQLLIAPGHNPLELSDADLQSIIDKYVWNKRSRRKKVGCAACGHWRARGVVLGGSARSEGAPYPNPPLERQLAAASFRRARNLYEACWFSLPHSATGFRWSNTSSGPLPSSVRSALSEICLSEDIQGINLCDVIGRASQNSKRPLPLSLPPASSRGDGNRVSAPRPRIKREKISSSSNNNNNTASSRSLSFAAGSIKIEDEEDNKFRHLRPEEQQQQHVVKTEPEDEELSSLSRYVTLASGEVRNEDGGDREESEEKRVRFSPAQSAAAKTRIFGQISKAVTNEVPRNRASSVNGPALNGTFAVKEEPQDPEVMCSAQDTSSNSSVLGSPSPSLPSCFLCLLRDLICQPRQQRLSRAVLENSARTWLLSVAASSTAWFPQLPSPSAWLQALPSAVNFLAGFTADVQPPDFVPYLEFKPALQAYQWIGAGRDADSKLQLLYHFWISNRSAMNNSWMVSYNSNSTNDASSCIVALTDTSTDTPPALGMAPSVEELLAGEDDGGLDEEPIPAPRCPTSWTVQPASVEERQAYRQQERMRYEKPHRAFTYRAHGYESVVGPVKGIYSQHSGPNKARGHSLLTPNRPPYVTILALVRDAVSRLPNGEGTRAEICELLRESQYLSPLQNSSAETALHSVVSGALDRLHYEQDPCVKYLANRKMWVYLHRNRDEHEFERMHHLNGPGGTKNKRPPLRRHPRPKTTIKEQLKPPPNVAIDPLNTSVTVDGGQIKMRPEDVLVKHDSSSANKLFSQIANSTASSIINKASTLSSASLSSTAVVSASSQIPLTSILSSNAVAAVQTGAIAAAVSSISPSVVTLSSSHGRQRTVDVVVSSVGGGLTTTTLSALKVSGNANSNTAGVRTLLASNLQTIQVSTASGIQTIRVALPASSAHHFAKGALVGRLASASGVVAINSRPGKKPQQQQKTIGQIIQTSSGAQFIATGLSCSTVGQLSPVSNRKASNSSPTSQVLKYGQQQQAVVFSASSGLPLANHLAGGASVVTGAGVGGSISGGRAVVISAPSDGLLQAQGSVSLSSTNPSVYGGVMAKTVFAMSGSGKPFLQTTTASRTAATAVVTSNTQAIFTHRAGEGIITTNGGAGMVIATSAGNSTGNSATAGSPSMELVYTTNKGKSVVVSSNAAVVVSGISNNTSPTVVVAGDSGTRAVQSISAHQLAGLKLIQTSVAAHHLQQGGGQTLLGQKLVMSGNKVLVQQGGKVVQAGMQQLMALQQQKSPGVGGAGGGLQRVTLVANQAGQAGYSSSGIITTTASGGQQRLLLGAHHTAGGAAGQIGGLVTVSGAGGGKQVVVGGGGAKAGTLSQQLPAGTVQGQLLLHGDKLGQVVIGSDKVSGQMMASIGGQQLLLTTASGSGGQQQLVLPASALQGGHIALKGLQSFHTLKVIPSGSVISSMGAVSARGRPMLARVVQQQSPRARVAPTQANPPRPLLSTGAGALTKQQNPALLQTLNNSFSNNMLASVNSANSTINNSNEPVDNSSINPPNS